MTSLRRALAQKRPGEITKREICNLLGISMPTFKKYTFLPEPIRRCAQVPYFSEVEVAKAIKEHENLLIKRSDKKELEELLNDMSKFVRGFYDREDIKEENKKRMYTAKLSAPTTTTIHIKGIFN